MCGLRAHYIVLYTIASSTDIVQFVVFTTLVVFKLPAQVRIADDRVDNPVAPFLPIGTIVCTNTPPPTEMGEY